MSLKIKSIQAAKEKDLLNGEWIVVANEGDAPVNTEGCSLTVTQAGNRPKVVTTLKAGLVIKPKEICRLVTGSSGKKSHGEAPVEDGVRNVHLFLNARYLDKSGLIVKLMNKQLELVRASYNPQNPNGLEKA